MHKGIKEHFADTVITDISTTTKSDTGVDTSNVKKEETKVDTELKSLIAQLPPVTTTNTQSTKEKQQPIEKNFIEKWKYYIIALVIIMIILVYLYYMYKKGKPGKVRLPLRYD